MLQLADSFGCSWHHIDSPSEVQVPSGDPDSHQFPPPVVQQHHGAAVRHSRRLVQVQGVLLLLLSL